MVLERVSYKIIRAEFGDEEFADGIIRSTLRRLKETVESKKPCDNWSYAVDTMKTLSWIKTYARRSSRKHTVRHIYYKATPLGIEIYNQLVQEGYEFPE